MSNRLRVLAGGAVGLGLVIWLAGAIVPPSEPVWKGHLLGMA